MARYIAQLKNGHTEILTEEEIALYLHLFTSEEIAHINEIHHASPQIYQKKDE
jgi:hypothetical protein